MNIKPLRMTLQALYYRLGGYSVAWGIVQAEPTPIQTRHGEMYMTWMIQFSPGLAYRYPLYLFPDLYMTRYGGKFGVGQDIAVKGALYPEYGLVWDAKNF